MINLFNIGKTAWDVTPNAVKEKISERVENSHSFQNFKKNAKPLFDVAEKANTLKKKGEKFLQEQIVKGKIQKMYADEKQAYYKMKADGIEDNEAFSLIKQRREQMLSAFGVENKITPKEKESLKKMRVDGVSSIDALSALKEYRSGFENRQTQIATEQKQAKQQAWDKHYESMPWYKKAGYHAFQAGAGIMEGAMGVGVNTVDFLAGGTETGRQFREAQESWNNDPMMNGNARHIGKFVGETATMAGGALVGGTAVAGTKTGAAFGAKALMTPASTAGGMALQGAVAGAGYGAWGEVANKGADATAEGIGKSALIGGAVGGMVTPLVGKVIAPVLGKAIDGTAKVGNAGMQAFKHTTGTLDDKVASAVNAIRKSTGRSIKHTGKAITNSAINTKDTLVRKFLSSSSDDMANFADDTVNAVNKTGKIQQFKNDMAGLDERDLQILRKTTTEEYDDWIRYAKDAVDNNYSQTPYHRGAKKANEAMERLEENIRTNQIQRMEIIENSGIQKVSLDDVRPKILEDLKKTFNIEGWRYGQKGEVIPQIVKGRKSLIDVTNARDMQAFAMLDDALKGGSPAEVMDTIRILQNHLYDSSTGLRVSKDMQKFLERMTGKMNHAFKSAMGDDYAKILAEMSDDIKLQKEIERIFKPSSADGVTNRGELAMKRLSNGTTTSGEVRDLALKIQERTGIDLIKESRLAQLSMDIVGDIRGQNLFGILQDTADKGILKGIGKTASKMLVNKESVARANTIKSILGIPKDVKINGLNKALIEMKFSKNDTKMITEIARKVKNNSPLTKVQEKNILTIEKLVAEKIAPKEVEKFIQALPHKGVGKGLTSIDQRVSVLNIANASKQFNQQLQKLIQGEIKKNEIMNLGLPSKILTDTGIKNTTIQIETQHLLKKSLQTNHPFNLQDLKDLPNAINDPIGIFASHTRKGSYIILTELQDSITGKNFAVAIRLKNNKINEIQSVHPRNLRQLKQTTIHKTQLYINKEKMKKYYKFGK